MRSRLAAKRTLNFGTLGAAVLVLATLPALSAERCAQCHPGEVGGFQATPMAHSVSLPAPEPAGKFFHSISQTEFSIKYHGSTLDQQISRGGLSANHPIAYAVGSGAHAVSYLIEVSGRLFQSPLCYYPRRARWSMAPGYENALAPDFYRPIVPHCLFCHASRALPVAGTVNGYESPPFAGEHMGITCERCHGPAEAHLRNPVPGSIVNPAKLAPAARDSVCEQCHLSGEAFIVNPGRKLSDFRPGESMENVFSVYVYKSSRDPKHPDALTVISQSQQLALSECARMSGGKLWCGTCHNPHRLPVHPEAYYRARCLSCHGAELLKTHPKPNENCIDCHMPRLPVTNGGHTIFTDHRIAIYPPQQIAAGKAFTTASSPASTFAERAGVLVPWREPPPQFARRNLGLADIEVGERVKSLAMIQRGYRLLVKCLPRFPNDPAVLTAAGQVLLGAHHAAEAEAMFERVIQIQPNNAPDYLHAALALKAAGNEQKAIEYLNHALQLDPIMRQPYVDLVGIYEEQGNATMLLRTDERYAAAFPKMLDAQRQLGGRRR
ncbi:MAG: hypothetical protein ACRD11_00365 [Terriglobia bacterium]